MFENGPTIIAILLTALGAVGLPIAILPIFIEVKPDQKKHVSVKEMIHILMWLALMVLGIVNLYVVFNAGNGNNDGRGDNIRMEGNQESDEQDGEDAAKQDEGGENADLSQEEVLIKQNSDLVQQLKAEYSDMDTKVIESESGSVWFNIYERAGYIFEDLKKTGEGYELCGEQISSAKVVILDYASDEIIFTLTSSEGSAVRYSPGNQNTFYCVVFHDDYNVYVTRPFQVVNGSNYGTISISLEKKDSQYTPLFQLRLQMRDSGTDGKYINVPSDYDACFSCKKKVKDDKIGMSYIGGTSESGILSWGDETYFSLNTDYVIDVYLRRVSDNIESTNQVFDGSITNSNQIDLYFEFDNID